MNITDLLTKLSIPYQAEGKHSREGWIQIDCPDCGRGSGKFHLGINETSLGCNCWQCGRKNLPYVLHVVSGMPYAKALESLREIPKRIAKTINKRGTLKFPAPIRLMRDAHRTYLEERGFDAQEIEEVWQVKGIGIAPKLAWRLFIPIYQNFEFVSWTTRAIGEKNKPRYISAAPEEEIINHKHLLYGADLAAHAVIIVEGATDAWRIGRGAVATLGLNVTPSQIKLMSQYPVRAVCFDNSVPAQKEAMELCRCLSLFSGQTINIQIDAEDPGSASPKEIQKIRKAVFK